MKNNSLQKNRNKNVIFEKSLLSPSYYFTSCFSKTIITISKTDLQKFKTLIYHVHNLIIILIKIREIKSL